MRWRAEVNKLEGVDSEVISPEEIKALVPFMDVSSRTRYPVLGALYHPPGGIIRHDAVNWGYARAADALGVEIHQNTEVLGISVEHGRVSGVTTSKGHVAAPVVVNCTAGWASLVAEMAGVPLPIVTHPLQAAVTEPVKMFLQAVVVSGSLHVYVSQTDRGELVFGASTDPYPSYSMRGSLEFTEELASHVLELMPGIAKMRVLRQWAGLCDITPGLLADHGRYRRRRFPRRRRVGHLRLQGGPGGRRVDGAAGGYGKTPELIAAVRPGPLLRGPPGGGARSGSSWALRPLTGEQDQEVSLILIPCPNCGPRNSTEFAHWGENPFAPTSRRCRPGRVEGLPLPPAQPGRLDHGDLVPSVRVRQVFRGRAPHGHQRGASHARYLAVRRPETHGRLHPSPFDARGHAGRATAGRGDRPVHVARVHLERPAAIGASKATRSSRLWLLRASGYFRAASSTTAQEGY